MKMHRYLQKYFFCYYNLHSDKPISETEDTRGKKAKFLKAFNEFQHRTTRLQHANAKIKKFTNSQTSIRRVFKRPKDINQFHALRMKMHSTPLMQFTISNSRILVLPNSKNWGDSKVTQQKDFKNLIFSRTSPNGY